MANVARSKTSSKRSSAKYATSHSAALHELTSIRRYRRVSEREMVVRL
jgi:hypothetical protein